MEYKSSFKEGEEEINYEEDELENLEIDNEIPLDTQLKYLSVFELEVITNII